MTRPCRSQRTDAQAPAAIAALLELADDRPRRRRTAGISESTLARWLREEGFLREYRLAQREALAQAIATLQAAAGSAVTVLRAAMLDQTGDPGLSGGRRQSHPGVQLPRRRDRRLAGASRGDRGPAWRGGPAVSVRTCTTRLARAEKLAAAQRPSGPDRPGPGRRALRRARRGAPGLGRRPLPGLCLLWLAAGGLRAVRRRRGRRLTPTTHGTAGSRSAPSCCGRTGKRLRRTAHAT